MGSRAIPKDCIGCYRQFLPVAREPPGAWFAGKVLALSHHGQDCSKAKSTVYTYAVARTAHDFRRSAFDTSSCPGAYHSHSSV